MDTISAQKIKGFVVSNVTGFSLIGLTRITLTRDTPGAGVLVLSEFVIIPILMGIICAWFWRRLQLKSGTFAYSAFNSLFAILLSSMLLGEGIICLLIVSPLIFLFMWLGTYTGRKMFQTKNNKLNVSIIGLLVLILIADSVSDHQYENKVSDSLIINAPPSAVWKNVVAFKKIRQKNNYWLFRIGLPSPVESTVEGYYNGAKRKCIFSNGYVFDERISTYQPGKNLVFDITNQPRDPEIMNHLDLINGQFLLKDNGDGTTTLTGNSTYKLYVFPIWYYDIWAQSIVRNVHIRVMKHIKDISEHPAIK